MNKRPCALVTGASGGLGAEIARVLAEEGFDLLLVARSEGKLQALKEELETAHSVEVQTFPADLAREDAALDIYDYVLGRSLRIDVLVNNAGFGDSGAFHEADVARDGYAAMRSGKAVCLQGAFTKAMAFGSRLIPRSFARKLAMRMNR